MDLKQLRYFVRIAEFGSLSAAAERLHVAQPSLSQHIFRIEEELGVPLLVRSRRGVTLTDGGQVFYERAREIIAQVESAIAEVRSHSEEARGPVSFGFPSSAANVLAVPLAETVRHDYPHIVLRAMEAMSGHVQEWLADGTIDMGLLYDINPVRHLLVQPLLSESLFLVSAREFAEGTFDDRGIAAAPIDLADCAKYDLILPNRSHGLRDMIDRAADANRVNLTIPLELDSLSQIKVLVERGSGFTILPHAAVFSEVLAGRLALTPIQNPALTRSVYLVKNPDRPATRAAAEVEKACINIVRELVEKGHWAGELLDKKAAR